MMASTLSRWVAHTAPRGYFNMRLDLFVRCKGGMGHGFSSEVSYKENIVMFVEGAL